MDIPDSIHALVKVEVNTAVDHLRETNRAQFEEIRREVGKRWRWITGASIVINLGLGMTIFQVLTKLPQYVEKQMLEPKVDKTVARIIETHSQKYINERLKPLEDRIELASKKLETIHEEISDSQRQLHLEQNSLKELVNVQQLATASRSGELGKR